MINKITSLLNRYQKKKMKSKMAKLLKSEKEDFLAGGSIPWSKGYHQHKIESITKAIYNKELQSGIRKKELPLGYGYRLDERVIEYPWLFSKMEQGSQNVLDAGSTFNYNYLVNHPVIVSKDLTICTFAPEDLSFNKNKISYAYNDLRNLPFKDNLFEIVFSQSTIEHIDMDNSMYGYDISHNEDAGKKSYDYLIAVNEMIRVLKTGGSLLLTFPYGKFEHHGFFQQFDNEMLDKILELFSGRGSYEIDFFRYQNDGWRFASQEELVEVKSYNPHTGKGAGDDHAAHSRAIACIEFKKDN